jgi:hypothetical protein
MVAVFECEFKDGKNGSGLLALGLDKDAIAVDGCIFIESVELTGGAVDYGQGGAGGRDAEFLAFCLFVAVVFSPQMSVVISQWRTRDALCV